MGEESSLVRAKERSALFVMLLLADRSQDDRAKPVNATMAVKVSSWSGYMTALSPPPTTLSTPQNIKRWNIEEYHKLSELGILNPNERTELIAGQIVIMAAKGVPHVCAVRFLSLQLDDFLRGKDFCVITQDPVQLDNLSEPEPDLIIAKGSVFDYTARHPQSTDIELIIEVADSTLKYDCNVKDKLYAQSNIVEYWVVDLKNRCLHVFQQPTQQGYSSHLILKEDNAISPLAFPALRIEIASILPPIS